VGEVELEFAVFTHEPFGFQRIAGEAARLRRLGMSLRAIGSALEVDEKTVRKALRNAVHAERQGTASGRHASCIAGSSRRPARKSHAGRRRHRPRS
jgi:ribosomal protein L4